MDTYSFIHNIENEDFYKDIANKVEKRFDTLNYEINRQFCTWKNKNVIRSIKNELERKIMKDLVALRSKIVIIVMKRLREQKNVK